MLEIFLVMALSGVNGRIAENRGRKPGTFKALTYFIWFGFEIVGIILGISLTEELYSVILIGFAFASVGALISFLMAKHCAPGEFVPVTKRPIFGAQMFPQAQPVKIVREHYFSGKNLSFNVYLNGQLSGTLSNDTNIVLYTHFVQNVLTLENTANKMMSQPVFFSLYPQSNAEIRFRLLAVMVNRSTNVAFLTPQQVKQMENAAAQAAQYYNQQAYNFQTAQQQNPPAQPVQQAPAQQNEFNQQASDQNDSNQNNDK